MAYTRERRMSRRARLSRGPPVIDGETHGLPRPAMSLRPCSPGMPSKWSASGVTAFAAGSHAQSDHRGEKSCRDDQEREAGPQPDGRNLSVAAGERGVVMAGSHCAYTATSPSAGMLTVSLPGSAGSHPCPGFLQAPAGEAEARACDLRLPWHRGDGDRTGCVRKLMDVVSTHAAVRVELQRDLVDRPLRVEHRGVLRRGFVVRGQRAVQPGSYALGPCRRPACSIRSV